jgi:hypothetical protein
MQKVLPFLLLVPFICVSQPEFQDREFSGTLKSFETGFGLAFEKVVINVNGSEKSFLFHPRMGKMLFDNFKIGDRVEVQVRTYPTINENLKNTSYPLRKIFTRDLLLSIKLNGSWLKLPKKDERPLFKDSTKRNQAIETFLDVQVKEEYYDDGRLKGLIFADGVSAYVWLPQKVKIGDVVSFRGIRLESGEGFQYPLPSIKTVYFYRPLIKDEGEIKSLLFKQNNACIGMVVKTKHAEFNLGFPSPYASKILELAEKKASVIFYYDDFVVSNQLTPPSLQVMVYNSDTLAVNEDGFYGGNDVDHQHKPVELTGKISRINRTEKGMIMDIIVDGKYYVDIESTMARQISSFFSKGKEVIIQGKERIKKKGEIYKKEYTIVVPKKIVIDGKTFFSNQP